MASSPGLSRVRVSAPATSANLGSGFDALGVALALRGEVELWLADDRAVEPDRGERMALQAVDSVYRFLGRALPAVRAKVYSRIPVARGLGASAMLRAGAAMAAAVLAGAEPEADWLLRLVAELEGHADNAAPALLGGLQVVVWDAERIWHVAVPFSEHLQAAIFVPEFEMSTDESRRLLPATLSRGDAVYNSSRSALLVAALATGNLEVLKTATGDRLHQPARSRLFPDMYHIFDAALRAGGRCAYLSGGGSAILAMADRNAEGVARAMSEEARRRGIPGESMITSFSGRGAEVVETA
jgi:homoserine kinase